MEAFTLVVDFFLSILFAGSGFVSATTGAGAAGFAGIAGVTTAGSSSSYTEVGGTKDFGVVVFGGLMVLIGSAGFEGTGDGKLGVATEGEEPEDEDDKRDGGEDPGGMSAEGFGEDDEGIGGDGDKGAESESDEEGQDGTEDEEGEEAVT